MDLVHIIDGLIGVLVMAGGWFLGTQAREVKRLDILINRTREDFVSRGELRIEGACQKPCVFGT